MIKPKSVEIRPRDPTVNVKYKMIAESNYQKEVKPIIKDCIKRGVKDIIIPVHIFGDRNTKRYASAKKTVQIFLKASHQVLIYMTHRYGEWRTYYIDSNGIFFDCNTCKKDKLYLQEYSSASFCRACQDFKEYNVQLPSTYCFRIDQGGLENNEERLGRLGGGPQHYDKRGTCQLWALLMVYVLLRFPNETPNSVINAMKTADSAKGLMNGFIMDTWNYLNDRVADELRRGIPGRPEITNPEADFARIYQPFYLKDVQANITIPERLSGKGIQNNLKRNYMY